MSDRSPQDRLDAWVLSYLDGQLTAEQFAKLIDAMRNDPVAIDRFVELASLDRSLQDSLTHSEQVQTMQQAKLEQADPALSFEATLELLGRGSESAELVHVHDLGSANPLQQLKPYLIGGAIAAVLVLAVTLTFVFANKANTTPDSVANAPSQNPPAATVKQVVATLTAEHDARWDQKPGGDHRPGALRPGTPLAAGDRLTLTAGFAEITTNDGAIAILEAPATIELLDNSNALRLHAGKLVGICETESSKGFLVRTPHMDITDLGTRFGVDASVADATEVHVFEGEVELSRRAFGTGTMATKRLISGQAMRAGAATDGFASTELEVDRFAKRPGDLLAGTGQGQSAGEIAKHWRIVAVDGQPVTQHGGLILVPEHHDGSSNPATSQWLKVNDALNPPGKGSAIFTCRSSFTVPNDVDPKTHELVIRCEADFSVNAVRINGQPLKVPGNRIGNGWITLNLSDHFSSGENTIEVDVKEFFKNNGKANSSSLRVEVRSRPRENF